MMLAALLLAVQPFVSEEIVWRTMPATIPASPRAISLAADGDGFVAAWSEQWKVYAARLDARGRLISETARVFGAGDAPSIAPRGDRVIAAWQGSFGVLQIGALDRSFNVVSERPTEIVAAPVVHGAYVAAGKLLYEVDGDGAPFKATEAARTIDDFTSPGDELAIVTHTPMHFLSVCGFAHCTPPFDTYALDFARINRAALHWSWTFLSDAPATVASNGDAYLIVYLDPGLGARAIRIRGADVRELALPGSVAPLTTATQPQRAPREARRARLCWR